MEIANVNQIGNCNLLNWNGTSVGIIRMRRMGKSSPLEGPVKIVAFMTLLIIFLLQAACHCKAVADWYLSQWFKSIVLAVHLWQIKWIQKFCRIINHFIYFHNSVDRLVCDCLALNVKPNDIKFLDVFVLSHKNTLFPQSILILILNIGILFLFWIVLVWVLKNIFLTNSSCDVPKSQKLWGNKIHSEFRSISTLLCPNSSNWWAIS